MTMTLIETKTLGTAAAQIEFTSIPQDGTDLLVFVAGRSNRTNIGRDGLNFKINGLTSGYSGRELRGFDNNQVGSTTSSTTFWDMTRIPDQSTTSNTFGNAVAYFPNYTSSVAKSVSFDNVVENNSATVWYASIAAGLQSNTSAITSIQISTADQFAIGTTASLYKITKGTDGIVVVS